ncbi:hypothetical protein VTK73DRAFT_6401 [Phialemonium thermophilum]|uniref:Uncharacterized protein n=1 Tax=Phialemonium thermophilum TaxID=223376 RepID=A0ABR3XVI0_9PEZI
MASGATSIPRFLLPQTARMWRRLRVPAVGTTDRILVRFASTTGSKPIVLEKPERFNPPSHGSRLPKKTTPRHYGGDLSSEEVQAQKKKDYPGLMAPEGTWAHWFWHSRALHLFITMGTLASLALFTFVQNFKRNSPFADMLPPASDFLYHPVSSFRIVFEVIRLSEEHNAKIVQERRMRRIDDVAKRDQYRKAHGLDKEGIAGFMARFDDKTEDSQAVAPPESSNSMVQTAGGPELPLVKDSSDVQEPRKKWLGIF